MKFVLREILVGQDNKYAKRHNGQAPYSNSQHKLDKENYIRESSRNLTSSKQTQANTKQQLQGQHNYMIAFLCNST
jgi:hypothetical protein